MAVVAYVMLSRIRSHMWVMCNNLLQLPLGEFTLHQVSLFPWISCPASCARHNSDLVKPAVEWITTWLPKLAPARHLQGGSWTSLPKLAPGRQLQDAALKETSPYVMPRCQDMKDHPTFDAPMWPKDVSLSDLSALPQMQGEGMSLFTISSSWLT